MIKTKEEAKARLEEAIQIQRQMQEFLDKYDSKEELFKQRDEWFLNEILKGLKIGSIQPDYVYYHNSKDEWMIRDYKNGIFWFSSYRICSVLRDNYYMQDSEIQQYLQYMLLTHFNWKVRTAYTPLWSAEG